MTVLLLFILAAQGSAAMLMPGDAQVERGPASGRLLVDSPAFLIINRTPVPQIANLSPDPTRMILWDPKEVPKAFGDIAEHDFLIHTDGSQFIMMTALECLGGAARKLQLDGDESQARAKLVGSFVCDLLDAYVMLSRFSQEAKVSETEALKASTVGIRAQLSDQRRQLVSVRSTPNKATALARGVEFALTVHFHVKKRDTGPLLVFPFVTLQDIDSLKSFPVVGSRLGSSDVKLDTSPLLTYQEMDILPCRLPETNVPQTIQSTNHSCFHWPWLQDAVQRPGSEARIQNARSQLAVSTQRTTGSLLPLLGNGSVESSLPPSINPVTVLPTRSFLSVQKPVLYKKLVYPEGSRGQAKSPCLFCGHRPYVKQLFYSIFKNEKGGGRRLNLDKYESRVMRRRFLDNLPRPFYAIFSFFLVIIFAWMLEQLFRILGNCPELLRLVNEEIQVFQQVGEHVVRHFYHNPLKPF